MRLHCKGDGSPTSESRLDRREASRAKLPVAPERRRCDAGGPSGGAPGLSGDRGLRGLRGLRGVIGLRGLRGLVAHVGEWQGLEPRSGDGEAAPESWRFGRHISKADAAVWATWSTVDACDTFSTVSHVVSVVENDVVSEPLRTESSRSLSVSCDAVLREQRRSRSCETW